MLAELRVACRNLARSPLFSSLAGLLLALGMSAAIAVFSVVDAVMLKALPYPDPDRIVTIWEATATSPTIRVSAPNFRDWQAGATSFAALAAWSGAEATVAGGRVPVVTGVYGVSRDYFAVFGVQPARGRVFVPEEMTLHGVPAVVVSHGFWQRVLGGATDLGAIPLESDGRRVTVVGVMPEGFAYPEGAEVWYPLESVEDTSGRTAHNLRVVARLADGVSLPVAQAEMTTIAQRLEAEYGADHDGTDASVMPLLEYTVRGSRQLLLALLAGVGIVLLATCANVANMLIARGTDRQREMAVRAALGAGTSRLVRMLLVENLVLATAAVALGLAGAAGLVRVLVRLAPATIPRLDLVGIDGRTALFAAGLAAVTPLAFGLLPALQASRRSAAEAMARGGRGTSSAGGRARQGLVAVEFAVALLLVAAAAQLGRSMLELLSVDPGYDPRDVITFDTRVPGGRFQGPEAAARLYDSWLAAARAVPGVVSVGLSNAPPLSGLDANGGFMLDGQVWEDIRDRWTEQAAMYRVTSAGYFDTIRARVNRGRVFDAGDVAGAEPVAVVNETLVRRHFPGVDPIGKRLRFAGMDLVNPWLTIVGVVADLRSIDLASDPVPEVFVDYRQLPMRTRYSMTTAIRLAPGIGAAGAVEALRAAWQRLDPDVPVAVSSLDAMVARSTASRRFALAIATAFGVMALVVAALGVYGILSYTVARRSREIGVRMALGASRPDVARLVVRSLAPSLLAGLVVGLLAAAGLTRYLQSLLYAVSPLDAATFGATAGILAAVALAAAGHPAWRAAHIDPAQVMRAD
ncbi:MAG: ABC transporter permease [Vicinamibacterales bacterium]